MLGIFHYIVMQLICGDDNDDDGENDDDDGENDDDDGENDDI